MQHTLQYIEYFLAVTGDHVGKFSTCEEHSQYYVFMVMSQNR